MIKTKVAFWRAGLYPANHSNLKSFLKALIGLKKAGPPKKPLLFWSCKQAIDLLRLRIQNYPLIFFAAIIYTLTAAVPLFHHNKVVGGIAITILANDLFGNLLLYQPSRTSYYMLFENKFNNGTCFWIASQ